jgi:hypothetical protein
MEALSGALRLQLPQHLLNRADLHSRRCDTCRLPIPPTDAGNRARASPRTGSERPYTFLPPS